MVNPTNTSPEVITPHREAPRVQLEAVKRAEASVRVECECVRWLREVRGIDIRGHAKDLQPNVDKPYPGGVVLIEYPNTSHAGEIIGTLINGDIYYISANESECEVTYNTIKHDSPRIRGYWYRNRAL